MGKKASRPSFYFEGLQQLRLNSLLPQVSELVSERHRTRTHIFRGKIQGLYVSHKNKHELEREQDVFIKIPSSGQGNIKKYKAQN